MRKLLIESTAFNLALEDKKFIAYRSNEGMSRNCYCKGCYIDAAYNNTESELNRLTKNDYSYIEGSISEIVLGMLNSEFYDKQMIKDNIHILFPYFKSDINLRIAVIMQLDFNKHDKNYNLLNYDIL